MNKNVTIVYLKKADKFLARNPHKLSKKDVEGDIRIIFHLADDGNWIVSVVEEIGYRGDVYK